jgi:hypothetical protein
MESRGDDPRKCDEALIANFLSISTLTSFTVRGCDLTWLTFLDKSSFFNRSVTSLTLSTPVINEALRLSLFNPLTHLKSLDLSKCSFISLIFDRCEWLENLILDFDLLWVSNYHGVEPFLNANNSDIRSLLLKGIIPRNPIDLGLFSTFSRLKHLEINRSSIYRFDAEFITLEELVLRSSLPEYFPPQAEFRHPESRTNHSFLVAPHLQYLSLNESKTVRVLTPLDCSHLPNLKRFDLAFVDELRNVMPYTFSNCSRIETVVFDNDYKLYQKINFCLMANAFSSKTMTTVSLRYCQFDFATRHCHKIEKPVRGSGLRSVDEQAFQDLPNLKTLLLDGNDQQGQSQKLSSPVWDLNQPPDMSLGECKIQFILCSI